MSWNSRGVSLSLELWSETSPFGTNLSYSYRKPKKSLIRFSWTLAWTCVGAGRFGSRFYFASSRSSALFVFDSKRLLGWSLNAPRYCVTPKYWPLALKRQVRLATPGIGVGVSTGR